MKILKIVLTAIMTACLCVGGICSFAFASDDTSVQTDSAEIALPDYKGTTYDVTMGTYGDQPIAFGTTEPVTTDTVYLQYTVVSYSFRGNGFGGLVRRRDSLVQHRGYHVRNFCGRTFLCGFVRSRRDVYDKILQYRYGRLLFRYL